jgi:hypothetical protein
MVNRTLSFTICSSLTRSADPSIPRLELKNDLRILILSVLRTHPYLSYFQGYHDIASVILLALGPTNAPHVLARLSLLRIRDFMLPTLTPTLSYLSILPVLLRQADPPLARLLPPHGTYALAATLTLFSHVVTDYANIVRLFDFLLASHAAAPIYLFAAVLKSRREELLELDPEDVDMLQYNLSKLPAPKSFDSLVGEAHLLLTSFPPESLYPNWKRISSASVLKTATSVEIVSQQDEEMAKAWWTQLTAETKKQDDWNRRMMRARIFIRRNKRPLMYGSSAVLVAVIATLAARTGGDKTAMLRSLWFGVWRGLGGR